MPVKAYKDPSSVNEVVITTNTITAAENGKTFVLSLAGGFTTTLPTAAKGLKFKFVVGIAPTTAYIINTPSTSTNVIYGSVVSSEEAAVVVATAADQINFVANKALVGDTVTLECHDGTNWSLTGHCNVQDAVTVVDN